VLLISVISWIVHWSLSNQNAATSFRPPTLQPWLHSRSPR
jgi:hypothetical protein